MTIWNLNFVSVISSFRGDGFLGNKVCWKVDFYYIVNVYSPCSLSLKRDLWMSLLVLKSKFQDGEWLIRGDFNIVKK